MRLMWNLGRVARAALSSRLVQATGTDPSIAAAGSRRAWRRLLYRLGTFVVSAVCLLFAWALFWPQSDCSEPICARSRFAVSVEIDALQQVPEVPLAVTRPVPASLQAMMHAGGIEIAPRFDQVDLPYESASGPLDQADLYEFAQAWRRRSTAPNETAIYALLAPALISDQGVPLFGLMFDTEGREGFAVAPAMTDTYFGEHEPGSVALLQLRTFAHELLHALNRHHLDAAQMSDGRLTVEAPSYCFAGGKGRQLSLRDAPLMSVSPSTILFFQTAAQRDVLPGKGHSAFDLSRTSPTLCNDIRQRKYSYPSSTRWEYAFRRLGNMFSIRTAEAAQQTSYADTKPPAVALRLQVMPAPYPLGYPVAVRVHVENRGDAPLPIMGRLHPGYGLVSIEYRRSGASEWQALQPVVRFEPVEDDQAMLAAGAATEETVPIYFGEAGWTFKAPGSYDVRARLLLGAQAGEALSSPVIMRVSAPSTGEDQAALHPLLDERGQLDDEVGRVLSFGGRIRSRASLAPLEDAVRNHGQTALGSALRLTLSSQRLRRPVDPLTGARAPPDVSDARELLADTCPDSGVAAMKHDLLRRYPGAMPTMNSMAASAGAWDGTTSKDGAVLATYSDPSLRSWGPSLHFCFDSAHLKAPTRRAIGLLAAELRRDRNARVVVVGHGDGDGTCQYNDALALRRAESVKRVLVRSGVRGARVQTASLGERRPMDFAASDTAHQLNRRVEILVDSDRLSSNPTQQRVIPKCPDR